MRQTTMNSDESKPNQGKIEGMKSLE